MSDFPSRYPARAVIGTFTPESTLPEYLRMLPNVSVSTSTAPGANRCIYVPLRLRTPFLAKRFLIANGGTVAGNFDGGIYAPDGTRLTSIGSTVQAGTFALQAIAFPSDMLLTPGLYYMALAMSSTGQVQGPGGNISSGHGKHIGLAVQAATFPLPAIATFATWDDAYCPYFGISRRTVN